MPAFYDFAAEQWPYIRTTSPIERVLTTVRHRTVRTKGCLSHATATPMGFKLVTAASRTWRRLRGTNQLPEAVYGVKVRDGIEATDNRPTTRDHQRDRRRLITPSPETGHSA